MLLKRRGRLSFHTPKEMVNKETHISHGRLKKLARSVHFHSIWYFHSRQIPFNKRLSTLTFTSVCWILSYEALTPNLLITPSVIFVSGIEKIFQSPRPVKQKEKSFFTPDSQLTNNLNLSDGYPVETFACSLFDRSWLRNYRLNLY